MIDALDDYLGHQGHEPIARPATSDPNYTDRYYFNAYNRSGDVLMIVGMTQYPNRGVTDAFVVAAVGDTQYVVRASRELGSDRSDTKVGPISVRVIEGLRRLRVACEPNAWGLSFDLTWTGDLLPFEEPPLEERSSFGSVIEQGYRFSQTGRWEGSLRLGGSDYHVTPDEWEGSRDHSWGVRSLREPGSNEERRRQGLSFEGIVAWAPIRMPTETIFLGLFEESGGFRERVFCHRRTHGEVSEPRRDLEISALSFDTQLPSFVFDRGEFALEDPADGTSIVFEVEPVFMLGLGIGTGYGDEDDWLHGMYQGPLVVQGWHYPLAEAIRQGMNTTLCRFIPPAGCGLETGMGVVDFSAVGEIASRGVPVGPGVTRVSSVPRGLGGSSRPTSGLKDAEAEASAGGRFDDPTRDAIATRIAEHVRADTAALHATAGGLQPVVGVGPVLRAAGERLAPQDRDAIASEIARYVSSVNGVADERPARTD